MKHQTRVKTTLIFFTSSREDALIFIWFFKVGFWLGFLKMLAAFFRDIICTYFSIKSKLISYKKILTSSDAFSLKNTYAKNLIKSGSERCLRNNIVYSLRIIF